MKIRNRYKRIAYARLRLLSRINALYVFLLLSVTIIFGAWVFTKLEGWSFANALYATVITLTTVGYGDFTPVTPAGRTFATFFTLVAIGIVGYSVSSAAANLINRQQKRTMRGLWERKMNRIASLNDHYILCGANPVGRRIAKEFMLAEKPFVMIDDDPQALYEAYLYLAGDLESGKASSIIDHFEDHSISAQMQEINLLSGKLGAPFLLKDATHNKTLLQAGLAYAKGLVTVHEDDKENLFIILAARQLAQEQNNPNLRIVSRIINEEHANKLQAAGADRIVSPNAIGSLQLASEILRPASHVFWDKILQQDKRGFNLSLSVLKGEKYIGKTVEEIRQNDDLAIVGLLRRGQFLPSLNQDTHIEPGDDLIIAVSE